MISTPNMSKCRIVTIEFNSLYLYYEIKRSLVHAASHLFFFPLLLFRLHGGQGKYFPQFSLLN